LQAFEVDLISQTRVYNKLGGKNPQFYVMRGGKSVTPLTLARLKKIHVQCHCQETNREST